jgi:hypothetical protein
LAFSAPGTPNGVAFTVTKSDSRAELAEADERPLLYSRDQTGRLLNVSVATVKRLEAQGLLTPIRLNKRSATGKVFHRRNEVFALAQAQEGQATFE